MSASVWDRSMQDIAGVIQALCPLAPISSPAATGTITAGNVLIQQVEEELNVPTFPAVIVTNQDMEEEEGESDFEQDAVIYPTAVVIVDSARQNFQGVRQDYLAWRAVLQSKFRGLVNYPLLGNTPEVMDVRLRNLKAIPSSVAAQNLYAMGFIVNCYAWTARLRGGNGV